jgi:hypothetical protein
MGLFALDKSQIYNTTTNSDKYKSERKFSLQKHFLYPLNLYKSELLTDSWIQKKASLA